VGLRDSWERNAAHWIRWAREPGHDSYWRFHRERFLELVPSPGRLTLVIGCGEGRVTRDLRQLGHRAIGVDASETMIAAALDVDANGEYLVADAAALPLPEAHADLAVAFISLMDVVDMPRALQEVARVMEPCGRLVLAVVHPINSGHELDREHPEDNLVLVPDYFDRPTVPRRDRAEGAAYGRPEAPTLVALPTLPPRPRGAPTGVSLAPPGSGDKSGTFHPQVRGER
jgi:SAM-dependent methyltransferase